MLSLRRLLVAIVSGLAVAGILLAITFLIQATSRYSTGGSLGAQSLRWKRLQGMSLLQCLRSNASVIETSHIITSENASAYDVSRFSHNRRISVFPQAIVIARSTGAVVHAVECARATQTIICARSGSHSFSGHSTCDKGLVVDLSSMSASTYDRSAKTITAEVGIKLGQMYLRLWEADRRRVPAGTCPTVGLGGHILGGGFGVTSRKNGMLSDMTVSLEMVSVDGEIIEVRQDNHRDLFWASRGGGGGQFGIVTKVTLNTVPADDVVIVNLRYRVGVAAALFERYSRLAPSFNDNWFAQFRIVKDAGWVGILAVYQGSSTAEATDFLAQQGFLDVDLGTRLETSFTRNSWIDAVLSLGNLQGMSPNILETIKYGVRADGGINLFQFNWRSRSSFVRSNISTEQAIKFVNVALASPVPSPIWQTYLLINAYGGAMGRVSDTDTPFFHRSARLAAEIITYWDTTESGTLAQTGALEWVENVYREMRTFGEGAYVNYADDQLTADQYLKEYFGDNVDRLMKVKTQYDSDNVLAFQQSIPAMK